MIYDNNGEVVYEMPFLNSLQETEGKIQKLREKVDKNDFELTQLDEKDKGYKKETIKKKRSSLIKKINERKAKLKRLYTDRKIGRAHV